MHLLFTDVPLFNDFSRFFCTIDDCGCCVMERFAGKQLSNTVTVVVRWLNAGLFG